MEYFEGLKIETSKDSVVLWPKTGRPGTASVGAMKVFSVMATWPY
ncbi:MAG: hypothetical protein NTV75_09595 [Bacteroidia bacterium]|nr:hypothetical protein [Bacteroidia bacterium]